MLPCQCNLETVDHPTRSVITVDNVSSELSVRSKGRAFGICLFPIRSTVALCNNRRRSTATHTYQVRCVWYRDPKGHRPGQKVRLKKDGGRMPSEIRG